MITYQFIGWCRDVIENHDKVWGVISLSPEKAVVFYGRRGKKLQTLIVNNDWDLQKKIQAKQKGGYILITESKLDSVYPDFKKDLEKTAFWASFKI